MAELEDVFKKAIKALEKASISYVVVGGVAAILHGSPRTTVDIDIIVQNSPHLIDKLIDTFQSQQFEFEKSQLRSAIAEGHNASIFTRNSVIRIDLKVALNLDEREVLQQAVEEQFMGIKIRIASIEQILYGKVLYLGDISDLTDDEILDFNDARDFINVFLSAAFVNLPWLEQKSKEKGLSDTLHRLLVKIDEIKSNNKSH